MADKCIEAIELFVQTDLIVDKGVGNFVKEFELSYWAPEITQDMTIQELIMESIGEIVLEEWRVADDIRRQIKAEADAIAAERLKKEQKIKDREEKTRKAEELRVKAKQKAMETIMKAAEDRLKQEIEAKRSKKKEEDDKLA